MNYKKYKFSNILKITSFMCLMAFGNVSNVDALKVKPVKTLPGVASGYSDEDVPVALEVLEGDDKIKTGAYLYRHVYHDVDYYAPWVPESIKETAADKNGNEYNHWGFWDMAVNKEPYGLTSPVYYKKAKVKTKYTSVTVYNSLAESVGRMSGGQTLKLYGITTDRVFLHCDDYTWISQGTSSSELVWINKDYVELDESTRFDINYPGYTSDVYLLNFKRGGKYKYNSRPIHYGVEEGRWINPNEDYVPSGVKGKNGEWRFIGYNSFGDPLDNPYFPADHQNVTGTYIYGTARRYTPWNKSDTDPTDTSSSRESDKEAAYEVFTRGLTSDSLEFTYDTDSNYSRMKDYLLDLLLEEKIIKTKTGMKQRISLKTNPYKQGIIMKIQRKAIANYNVPFLKGVLRDLYAYSMEIWEVETNTKIASLTGSSTKSKVTTSGQYKPGRTYEARVKLANGVNATPIVNSLEANFGLIYNADNISDSMIFAKTRNQQTQRQGNFGGITSQKGSVSNEFKFRFYVSSNQTGPIDVYGFVGFSHTGVDNVKNYENDLIGIRLAQDSTPPSSTDGDDNTCVITNNGKTKTCGSSDIVPVSIQLIDEDGVVQYTYNATNGITKQNAIIPGKKYKIKYNAKVSGEISVSTWVDAVNDNPNTDANEYREGYWQNVSTPTYKIPLKYKITRPVKNPSRTESYSSDTVLYFVDSNGSQDIPISNNKKISYTTGYMVMQYPELTTKFTITSTNSNVNSNRNNDSLSATVIDNFDIGMNSLVISPIVSYTDGTAKKVSYNISYNATLTTPSYVTSSDYQAYVKSVVNINGTEKPFYIQLTKGSNNKITHVVEDIQMPASGSVTASVELNKDRLSYESGDYSNNKLSTIVKTEIVRDPGRGSVTDTVRTPVQDDNNPSAGGNANNNCLIPRTKNTWTSTHRKYSWTSSNVSYNTLVSGETVTFKKYNLTYNNNSETTETYDENFSIQKILFKSKETEGKGENGWINLLSTDPNVRKLAIVKAGYGFELKIIVNYNTDALSKRSWIISNDDSSGTNVSALNGGVNYGMEAVFLELPGTQDTRKILSNVAYGKAIKGLNVTKTGTTGNTTWTYTIKSSNTTGSGSSPKIYIPTNMKDGDYKLKIYTTPLPGVGSVDKNTYSALCDRKEVLIKVKGSASNDLDSNIIQ